MKLPRQNVLAVTMPCFGTTERTKSNAIIMAELLGVSIREVDISKSVKQHFEDIGHDINNHNLTYENVAYMGDDIPDICVLEKVALACCPNDAVKEVQEICNFKSSINGGRGAVREFCDFILEAQNIEKIALISETDAK